MNIEISDFPIKGINNQKEPYLYLFKIVNLNNHHEDIGAAVILFSELSINQGLVSLCGFLNITVVNSLEKLSVSRLINRKAKFIAYQPVVSPGYGQSN